MNLLEPLRDLSLRSPEATALWHHSTGTITWSELWARVSFTEAQMAKHHPEGGWVKVGFPKTPQDYIDLLALLSRDVKIIVSDSSKYRPLDSSSNTWIMYQSGASQISLTKSNLEQWYSAMVELAPQGGVATEIPLCVLLCLVRGISVVLPKKTEIMLAEEIPIRTLIAYASTVSTLIKDKEDYFSRIARLFIIGHLDTQEGLLLKDLLPNARISFVRGDLIHGPFASLSLEQALAFSQRHGEPQLALLGEPLSGAQFEERSNNLFLLTQAGPPVHLEHYTKYEGEWVYRTSTNDLEFNIQKTLLTGRVFLHKLSSGRQIVVGDIPPQRFQSLKEEFPIVSGFYSSKLKYSPEYGDEIDRRKSLRPLSLPARWRSFIVERCAVVPIIAVSVMATVLVRSLYPKSYIHLGTILSLVAFVMALILAVVLREQSSYVRDCIVNPSRPLPRGLLNMSEIIAAIWSLRFGIWSIALISTIFAGVSGGAALLILALMLLEGAYRLSFGRTPNRKQIP